MSSYQQHLFSASEATASPQPVNTLSILGISKSGEAAARLAYATGVSSILLSDANPNTTLTDTALAPRVKLEAGQHDALFKHADTVVLSPGVPPHTEVVQHLRDKGFTLLSEPDWAHLNQPQNVQPWVGVTGTNGKSTITSLIAHLLNALTPEAKAVACGNIGHAVSDVMVEALKAPDVAFRPVVELSSYQLEYSHYPRPAVGVFSNLTPDHLDWHGGLDAYQHAKEKLFLGEMAAQTAVLNLDDPVGVHLAQSRETATVIGIHTKPHALTSFNIPQLFVNEDGQVEAFIPDVLAASVTLPAFTLAREAFPFMGPHHTQNFLLGLGAVLALNLNGYAQLTPGYQQFQAMPHRFEKIMLPDGKLAINDSKATNPEAAMAALSCFSPQNQVVLLAGGKAKKTPLRAWAELASANARAVICFGRDGADFEAALKNVGYAGGLSRFSTLKEAITAAKSFQDEHPDLPLLFAPGAASQDEFENFEVRGTFFSETISAYGQPS